MYLVGNEITITWILAPTDTPLVAADYDIRFVGSNLDATYTDAAVSNYIAPTINFAGSITYAFTPASSGHYKVLLTYGADTAYLVLDEKNFWVFGTAP